MARLCSWEDFLRVMKALGYRQEKPPKCGGSGVPFSLPDGTRRNFHRPHNGAVLRPEFMAKRLGITKERFMELAR